MKHAQPVCGTDIRLPEGALNRLALFAEWTATTPPATIVVGQGDDVTFAPDLLAYAQATGLSLDWFWLDDERSLVMQAHNRARAA